MPDQTTFLKFKDEHGVTADGNLEPLVQIGLVMAVPVMIPNPFTKIDEPGEAAQSVIVDPADTLGGAPARIVPGTRLIEVADSRVVSALLYSKQWELTDPPSRTEIQSARALTTDASTEAGTHSDPDQAVRGQEA
jgi:hypothetical protein